MRKKIHIPAIWCLLGPGLLAALADNDAGGIISYTVTGTKFGAGIFIPLTLALVFITYTVQEMAMRLGVVTGEGYTHLIRKHYGRGWMIFQIITLLAENLITLVTEFIGMGAGLAMIGVPHTAAVLISVAMVLSIAVFSGYSTKERIGLAIGLMNFVFLVIACFTTPNIGFFESFSLAGERDFIWYMVALVGNAIAPWMIFYQSSAYVDKGVKAKYIKNGRTDTIIGCVCQVAVAAVLIFIGSSLFGAGDFSNAGPMEMILALQARFGAGIGYLFALGLFNAGLLAAITVSLSSSWAAAEAFGWSKSLNDKIAEAPGFYAIYFVSVMLAAGAVLIPELPLNQIAVFAQVAGGILMMPILLFLTLLTSNKGLMGDYANRGQQKVRSWISVGILMTVSLITALTILF